MQNMFCSRNTPERFQNQTLEESLMAGTAPPPQIANIPDFPYKVLAHHAGTLYPGLVNVQLLHDIQCIIFW